MRMNVGELARELAKTEFWAKQPRSMLILAARFYSGVDSLDQLRHMAEPAISSSHYGYDHFIRPTLTEQQVQTIINLR
jgi:hypothetical protein